MHSCRSGTIQRAILIAPFPTGELRSEAEAEWRQQGSDTDGVRREQLTDQCDHWAVAGQAMRPRHRSCLGFLARITQHCRRQNILRLGMSRHTKARHIDTDDPDAVDLTGQ